MLYIAVSVNDKLNDKLVFMVWSVRDKVRVLEFPTMELAQDMAKALNDREESFKKAMSGGNL